MAIDSNSSYSLFHISAPSYDALLAKHFCKSFCIAAWEMENLNENFWSLFESRDKL